MTKHTAPVVEPLVENDDPFLSESTNPFGSDDSYLDRPDDPRDEVWWRDPSRRLP